METTMVFMAATATTMNPEQKNHNGRTLRQTIGTKYKLLDWAPHPALSAELARDGREGPMGLRSVCSEKRKSS